MDQPSRFSRLTLFLAVPLLILLSIALFWLGSNPAAPSQCANTPWLPAAPPHTLNPQTNQLQPLWQLADLYIYDENIALNKTAVYLTGSLAQCDAPHALHTLSPETGDLLTTTPFGFGLEGKNATTLAAALNHPIRTGNSQLDEFIGLLSDTGILDWRRLVEFGLVTNLPQGPSNESQLIVTDDYIFAQRLTDGRFYAYPLDGSDPIWEHIATAWQGSTLFQASGHTIINETAARYSQSGSYRYTINNVENGEQRRYFFTDPLLYVDQTIGYQLQTETNTLQAINLEDGRPLWQTPLANPATIIGLFDQTILLQLKSPPNEEEPEQPTTIVGLLALSSTDGSILWSQPLSHAPSVAIHEQTLFAFAEPNQLISMNLNNGSLTEQLTISPELTNEAAPILLAENGRLLLYLPTSRQLFAFRHTPQN